MTRSMTDGPTTTTTTTTTPPPADGEAAGAARAPGVRVGARPGWVGVNWRELWQYRDLLGFLAGRDIRVRYKQTALGVAWALLQPVGETLAWFFLLLKLGGVQSDGPAYLVFAYAAMLVWKLFETALTQSSNSLVSNQQLLTKVYFPRLIIPVSAVLSGVMDFAIAAALLIPMMIYYKIAITPVILLLPLFVAFTIVAALAVGLWLSALNVQYRDVRYVVPFLLRVWFVLTPVIYPASKVPAQWQLLYGLNPMAGAVTGFRWALLGGTGEDPTDAPGMMLLASVASTIVLLIGGLFYFRRMEKTFADIV
jgi:lipopolysaccharide transport system permease protein